MIFPLNRSEFMKNTEIENMAEKWFEANINDVNANWFDLLRFKTVGTDLAYLDECRKCVAWLEDWLAANGFSIETLGPKEAPQIIYAVRKGESDGTALFYGHYDVQPADVAEGWNTDPWEPVIENGRVYARGAQDNKGQVWASLQSIKACIDSGVPLPDLKIVLEGQEESGSDQLIILLEKEPERFKADVVIVCDTSMMEGYRPVIIAGLRGVSSISLRLDGPDYDLHSGSHGGLAPNPATVLAKMVSGMFNQDGSIAVEGFLDEVKPPTEAEINLAMSEPFDEIAYKAETGVLPTGGTIGVPPEIRGALLPTIDVNGFHSGYGGPGGKTIIPAYAEVKLSMRTVSGQDPHKCIDSVRKHFESRVPDGMRISVADSFPGKPAFKVAVDSPFVIKARQILSAMHPDGCAIKYDGASIHVVGTLSEISEGDTVLAGFGLSEDRIHGANESFSFKQFKMCFDYTVKFLSEIGKEI